MFNPSPQQQAILDFFDTQPEKSLMVDAKAGSGKTKVLEMLSHRTPTNLSCVALAFAKVNAVEFEGRFAKHYQCGTFHSRSFKALQRNLPARPRVDVNKTWTIIKDTLGHHDTEHYGKFLNRLVGYGKNAGLGTHLAPNVHDEWYNLIDHFSLQLDSEDADEETAVGYAIDLLDASASDTKTIDFDDMLWLALKRRVIFDKMNVVMLDEAQDTNGVQRELLKSMVAPNGLGRVVIVGDPFQSIYGFRGADADAMTQLRDIFNCETLSLSVSWRCSKVVVAEARTILMPDRYI